MKTRKIKNPNTPPFFALFDECIKKKIKYSKYKKMAKHFGIRLIFKKSEYNKKL